MCYDIVSGHRIWPRHLISNSILGKFELLNPLLAWVSGIVKVCLKTSKQQAIGSNPIRFTGPSQRSCAGFFIGRRCELARESLTMKKTQRAKRVGRPWVSTSQESLDHPSEARIIQSGSHIPKAALVAVFAF